jgi:hypothetical protein
VEASMKNIVLDLMMGLLCITLTISLFGIVVIPEVLEVWCNMRKS